MRRGGNWIDLPAAERRLGEIDRELERISGEKALIELVLGRTAGQPANRGDTEREAGVRNGFHGPKRHVPLADLVVEALRRAPPQGCTVSEIIRHIAAKHPERASDPRLSATVSSAIGKARSTKNPRIKILRRGRKGEASRYAAIE